MSKPAASAAQPSMCPHIIENQMQIPFGLYITKKQSRYLCCDTCLTSAIERRLTTTNEEPSSVAESVVFSMCDHGSTDRACWICLESARASLVSRWAALHFTNRPLGNQLKRIAGLWNRFYDPADTRSCRRTGSLEAGAAPRRTAAKIAEDRRDRANATRIKNRRAAIRERRRIPDSFALQVKQASRIEVVKAAPQHSAI